FPSLICPLSECAGPSEVGDGRPRHHQPVAMRSTSCFTVGIKPLLYHGSWLKRNALWPANMSSASTFPSCAMFCSVFWMQKLRGSALRPVLPSSFCDQLENWHADRQPMHAI